MSNEDEREDTLTNIRAIHAGVANLFEARGQDRTRIGKLVTLAFGAVLVVFVVGLAAATHMSQGISDIREDQQIVHGDISKILTVTTNLVYEAEQARAHEHPTIVIPPEPAPSTPPPATLDTQVAPE